MSATRELTLNLLLFSVGGVRFGCDAEQAAGIAAFGGAGAEDLFWFHEEFGFRRPVSYHAPTVVTVKTGGPSYRVIIDSMEQIAQFCGQQIRLLPALLEPFALQKGIWGVLQRNQQMVLLVDFQLLLKNKALRQLADTKTEEGDSA